MVISWQALRAISPTVRMMDSGQRYESFNAYISRGYTVCNAQKPRIQNIGSAPKGCIELFLGGAPRFDVYSPLRH